MNAAITSEIGQFLTRNSKDGLFLHYARRSARDFLIRQTMTLIGSVSIAAQSSIWLGVLAGCLVLIGEAIDCVGFFHISRRFAGQMRRGLSGYGRSFPALCKH